jgi:hypothetical protein
MSHHRLSISDLANMLHDRQNGRKAMIILKSYFDDAGTHLSSGIVGLGGFVGAAKVCQSLEDQWQGVLDEFTDYGVQAFHSYSCEWGEDDFCRIPREIREAIRDRLARLLGSHLGILPIWCAVVNEDWAQISDELFLTAFPTGYHFCFRWCINRAAMWSTRNADASPVVVTISEDNKNAETLTTMFNAYKRAKSNAPLRAIAFGSYRDIVCLQPADMIAYETFREWSEVEFGSVDRPLGRVPWETLGESIGFEDGRLFTLDALKNAVRDFHQSGIMRD